jgi:hypothetical protein
VDTLDQSLKKPSQLILNNMGEDEPLGEKELEVHQRLLTPPDQSETKTYISNP